MAKDRLEELRNLSSKNSKNENGQVSLEMGDASEKSSLLDPFFSEVEKIETLIEALNQDIHKVQKAHSFLLNAQEPDKKIVDSRRDELDQLNHQIKKSSIVVKNTLQQLKESNDAEVSQTKSTPSKKQPAKLTLTQQRIRETQINCLHKRFLDLMTDHSQSQSDYNDKHKKLLRDQVEIVTGGRKNDDEIEQMLTEPLEDVFTGGHLKETQNARQQLAEVNARHKIILDIEKSIREVHHLFVEMATIVEQQGELIDIIERNVVKAAEATSSGQSQLKEAREKKRSARKKKYLCYAIIAVLVIIIIAGIPLGYL